MQKAFKCLLAVLAAAAGLGAAEAQSFPTRPIQIIITATPGSVSDVLTRTLANDLTKSLGQPILVVSKASASGTVGADQARRSPPDGHTLFLGGNTTMSANVFLFKSLPYDPVRDFDPVSLVTINPLILVIRAELPIKSVADLIAYGKAHPGQMNYGIGNSGGRVAVQLLESLAGITAQDVTFRGSSQAMLELAAGRLDFMFVDPLVAETFIKQGKVRALAVSSSVRLPSMPELPTMIEAGVPGYDYSSYLGYYAPHGTPRAVIATLNAAFVKAIGADENKDFFRRMAMIGRSSTPEELTSYQKGQTLLWGRLVKESGLEPQ